MRRLGCRLLAELELGAHHPAELTVMSWWASCSQVSSALAFCFSDSSLFLTTAMGLSKLSAGFSTFLSFGVDLLAIGCFLPFRISRRGRYGVSTLRRFPIRRQAIMIEDQLAAGRAHTVPLLGLAEFGRTLSLPISIGVSR
jgi:hypothetical protein